MRARAHGRPKPGSTLLEGRGPYPATGVSVQRAHGRPKPGSTLSEGRAPYPATGVSV